MTFQEILDFAGRHSMLAIAFVGLTLALIYTEIARLFRPYKPLSPAELTALVNREDAVVVDISASGDFEKGHIAGSRNVQASALAPDHRVLAGAGERAVVLVCRSGQTASAAAARLHKAGIARVHVLDGGIAGWQQAGLPLVKGRA